MTTLRQAAEMALEAMKDFDYDKRMAAIEAVEKALAEPEQNCKTHPDAPHGFCRNASLSEDRYVCECEFWEPPQRQWEGLTDDETMILANETSGQHWMEEAHIQRFRAAIEEKLKEKNT